MSDIYLNDWEKRPDWKEISESVMCEVCGRGPGAPCRDLSQNPYLTPKPRAEVHMARKWKAIRNFLGESEPPNV